MNKILLTRDDQKLGSAAVAIGEPRTSQKHLLIKRLGIPLLAWGTLSSESQAHVPDKMDGIRNVDHADLSVLEIPQMRRRYNLPANDGYMCSKKQTKKFPKGNLVPVPTRESIV